MEPELSDGEKNGKFQRMIAEVARILVSDMPINEQKIRSAFRKVFGSNPPTNGRYELWDELVRGVLNKQPLKRRNI